MKRYVWIFTVSVVALLLIVSQKDKVIAASGDLDLTFGNNGVVVSDLGGFDVAIDVAMQTDGKIVTSGGVFGSQTSFAVVRYESDGTPDVTFGTNGITTTHISSTDIGREIAIQPDGKIIVGGSSELNGNKDFMLVRYNSDGSLDTTYDSDGVVVTAISSGTDEIWGITLQPDGKIVAAGESNGQMAIVRYNSDGSVDTSFGTNGIVTLVAGRGHAVVIQPDGKIVTVGRAGVQFAVVRLNTNGTLDNSFDTDGIVTTPMGDGAFVSAYDVNLQLDGKIVVAGTSYNGTDFDVAAVRYNSDGSLDTSFSTDGKVIYDSGNGTDEGSAIAIQANGKILVGGYSNITGGEIFTLFRFNTDGTLDTGFSDDGIVTTSAGQRGLGLVIQADNQIVMTGYQSGSWVTARYEGEAMPILDEFIYLPVIQKP